MLCCILPAALQTITLCWCSTAFISPLATNSATGYIALVLQGLLNLLVNAAFGLVFLFSVFCPDVISEAEK